MKHDDAKVLQEIQRNTEMGMTAIETILDKIEDDEFSLQLSRQSLRYSEIHNKALDQILEKEGEVYHGSQIADLMLKGSIHVNTALNLSKEHLAEMMIQGSNRGITSMWKALRHNQLAGDDTVELAKELMDFEEKSIECMKEYL
ncbi:MAG: hypothetical protein K2P48_07335 [Lachnospiraceae bacterium]|nr:hypothetical protein [Lachnospiraceae bacterium]